jgi:hypothetical protein
MKPFTEDKVVLVLSVVLVIITAVAFNVRPGEAAYELEPAYGAEDTGDDFELPCNEAFVLASFQAPILGEEDCDEGVVLAKRVVPEFGADDNCPPPLFLARFIDGPDESTQDCPKTSSVISL